MKKIMSPEKSQIDDINDVYPEGACDNKIYLRQRYKM